MQLYSCNLARYCNFLLYIKLRNILITSRSGILSDDIGINHFSFTSEHWINGIMTKTITGVNRRIHSIRLVIKFHSNYSLINFGRCESLNKQRAAQRKIKRLREILPLDVHNARAFPDVSSHPSLNILNVNFAARFAFYLEERKKK